MLLAAAMLTFTMSASAQATYTDKEGAVYTFQKHWFLELEKGGWNGYVPLEGGLAFTKSYKYKYVAPGLDVIFNISNLIAGYNPTRFFNLKAYLGAGANIALSGCRCQHRIRQRRGERDCLSPD